MQTVLQQEQIDALFAAQGIAPSTDGMRPAEEAAAFHFGGAGQISSEQMRAISLVNDHFARNVMHTLGAWLRTQMLVALVACEQMPFSEFLSRIPEPAYLCTLRLEPLGAVGLLELDLPLAMAAMELLLGGRGSQGERRQVTDIEDAILASVMDVIVRELNAAWQTVGLSFAFEKRDSEGRVPRLLPAAERTLCVSFEVQFLGVQGMLNFCFPAVVLNTVHRRLMAMREEPRPRFAGVAVRVAALLADARVPVSLRSQPVRLPSRAIAALQAGSVLELALQQHAPAELRVRGIVLSAAMPAHRAGLKAALIAGSVDAAVHPGVQPESHSFAMPAESLTAAAAAAQI